MNKGKDRNYGGVLERNDLIDNDSETIDAESDSF